MAASSTIPRLPHGDAARELQPESGPLAAAAGTGADCAADCVGRPLGPQQGDTVGYSRVSGQGAAVRLRRADPARRGRLQRRAGVVRASELGGWHWAVKAQIHSGARGKAGGIKLCRTYHEVHEAATGMLGRSLVTHQTGPEGKVVQRVYVEVAEKFERELYLGMVLDRKAERVRVIASAQGGMEIEEIARTSPQAHPAGHRRTGGGPAASFRRARLAFGLGLNIKQVSRAVAAIMGAYRAFRDARCHDGGDQPAGGDRGRSRDRARCQDVVR